MIVFNNVRLSFNSQTNVLNISKLSFPKKGLICIKGPSGCGKTSLLNIIAGFINHYKGEVLIKNRNLKHFTENALNIYRNRTIGFIFQHYLLLESQNVYENIVLPLRKLDSLNERQCSKKVNDLLFFVGLYGYEAKNVSLLSGGEKQRVAIARALVNDPEIILADEPTGALDVENKHKIMNILQTLASEKLVIMVSHDDELIEQYGDQIINLEYGKVSSIKLQIKEKPAKRITTISVNKLKNSKLPLLTRFKLGLNILKKKRIRTSICIGATSIGLIGIGVGTMLMTTIKQQFDQTFNALIPKNTLIVQEKNGIEFQNNIESCNKNEAYLFAYQQNISNEFVGVNYLIDFNNFFKTKVETTINMYGLTYDFRDLSLNCFKEIIHPSEVDSNSIYPKINHPLQNDEIILNLGPSDYRLLHQIFGLNIQSQPIKIGEKLSYHKPQIIISVENEEWGYEDEQVFNLVAVRRSDKTGIIHNNLCLPEVLFENQMRLLSNLNLSQIDELPWTLKKNYYLLSNESFKICEESVDNPNFLLELGNEKTFITLDNGFCQKRILLYKKPYGYPVISKYQSLDYLSNKTESYFYTATGSFMTIGNSLISGFQNPLYFSSSESLLEEVLFADQKRDINNYEHFNMPDGTASSSLSLGNKENATFSALKEQNVDKNKLKYNEIIISKGLENKLFGHNVESINKTIFIATEKERIQAINGNMIVNYVYQKLKVVSIINEEKLAFYHKSLWPIIFYKDFLGFGAHKIIPNGASITLKDNEKLSDQEIERIKQENPKLQIINPSKDLSKGIDETINRFTKLLLFMSIFALFISIIIVIMVIQLTIIESKKEFYLFRFLGININEIRSIFFSNAVIIGLISSIFSNLLLFVINIVVNIKLSEYFMNNVLFSFNIIPHIFVTFIGIVIAIIGGFISSFTLKKGNPLTLFNQSL